MSFGNSRYGIAQEACTGNTLSGNVVFGNLIANMYFA
jgi:parallel beta-helix repeat protein